MTYRPCRRRSRRNRYPYSQPHCRKSPPHIFDQPLLAAEQMCHPGHVELQPVAVHLDQRRPAGGPPREAPHQRRIPVRIGRNRHQCGVERARVGQPCAGASAAYRGGFGDGMDDRPVRAFDGEDDRIVRR